MKKETFNLVVRFLVGLALSLLICAGMIMTGKLGSDKPLLQQASGLKGTEAVMTVDGEPVESWEYLYMVTYSAQNLSYYGVTDLSTQLGEGFTAADYVAQQAEAQVKQQAAVRKWAKDMGITLTEDDGATLQQKKEAYGEDLQKVLQINGLTEEQYDQLMSTTLLYNRLYAAYCTTDGALRPSDKDLLALAEEHSLMTADVLFISTAELDDAAKAVTVDGEMVSLTPIEYNILLLLMQNPGRVYSTGQIYELVWNDPALGSENTVAVHIRHLREKLEIDPANPRYLKVVWGLGYKMEKL